MWLPAPIYERTPQLWLLMAVLFVVLGLYIGFAYKLTYFYVLLGIICAIRGIHVSRMRSNFRQTTPADAETGDGTLAETAGN